MRNTLNHVSSNVDGELSACVVVEEEERFGTLNDQIVDRHGYKILTDSVVLADQVCNLQLGAHTVSARHKNGVLVANSRKVKQSTKPAQLCITAGAACGLAVGLDPLHKTVASIDVHTSHGIGHRLLLWCAIQCLVGNVPAVVHALKAELGETLVGLLGCLPEGVCHGRDCKDTATAGLDGSIVGLGAGMEHVRTRVVAEGHHLALGVVTRITAGHGHHGDGLGILKGNLDRVKAATHTRLQHLHQVHIVSKQSHQHLRLWVTETAVVFQHTGTIGGEHKAHKQDTNVRDTAAAHAINCWFNDCGLNLLHQSRGAKWRRSICTHATGVQTRIPLANLLVVLDGGQQHGRVAVGQCKYTDLWPSHVLLNYHLVTCGAKDPVDHDLLQCLYGLLLVVGQQHTLACCKP
eukprot:comp23753_c0_seq1/m.41054 comp23753_c0_seq1/g.41054  ORF comp23753_c0_seq1/g.41054 comp23753_c0_seq1/m.41054 type:complete len:406 (+) comp23753_c0_seq1:1129-2346(+)